PFNHWIRALGAFPIDQDGSALAGIRATLGLLKENNAVLVFPEGSRSPDGQLHKMLSGFCILARRSQATIVPLALEGAFAALPRGAILVKPHSICLKFTNPITPAQFQKLTDAQLTNLVAERISQALATTRRELATDSYFAGFLQPKRENLLLAKRPEPAYAADGHIK
ncbi:MAG TPA: lysophospholipid acyltransferase family protein, partial [Lacipirellulaceae bacterium]|nr:lysophospholipid acyltransferase family protein [Lacipirellulaceae bacterium]